METPRKNVNKDGIGLLGSDHCPQGAFDNRAEEGICRSIYLFTGIPVTIELIELSDSIIVFGQPLKI